MAKKKANAKKAAAAAFHSDDDNDDRFDLEKQASLHEREDLQAADESSPAEDSTAPPVPSKSSNKSKKAAAKNNKKNKAPAAALSFDLLADEDDQQHDDDDKDVGDEQVRAYTTHHPQRSYIIHKKSPTLERQMSDIQLTGDHHDDEDGMPPLFSVRTHFTRERMHTHSLYCTYHTEPTSALKKKKKSSKKITIAAAASDDDDEERDDTSQQELMAGKKKKKSKKKDVQSSLEEGSPTTNKKEKSSSAMFRDADEGREDGEDEKKPDGHFARSTEHLTATGILLSHERSKDIQIDKFTVAAYGQQLVKDTSLSILYGHRYGLVGNNGCGKSTLYVVISTDSIANIHRFYC